MLYNILREANIPFKDHGINVGREFINICCPFCHEGRFHCGINTIDFWFKCFVCNESGSWYKLSKCLKKDFSGVNWKKIKPPKKTYHIPVYEKPVISEPKFSFLKSLEKTDLCFKWLTTEPGIEFLNDKFRPRGLPGDILNYVEIYRGTKKFKGYVVFKEGDNISGRKYNPDILGARWKKNIVNTPFIYGENVCKKFCMPVGIITEGIFDMLHFPQGTAIALSGVAFSDAVLAKVLKTFDKAYKIILALDRGVKEKMIQDFYLSLSDFYEVDVVDWSTIKNPNIKDLDELAVVKGNEYLLDFVGLPKENLI